MSSIATSYISSANSTKQPFNYSIQQADNTNQKQKDKDNKHDHIQPSQQLLKQMEQLGLEKILAQEIVDDLEQKDRFEDIVCLDYETDLVLVKANDVSLGKTVTIKVRRVELEGTDIRFKELIDKLNVFKVLSVNNPEYFVEIVEVWVVSNLIFIEEIDLMCEDLSDWLEARNGNALKIEERTSQVFQILRILLILENSGQKHNGINPNAFAVRSRQPALFLSECQPDTHLPKPLQNEPSEIYCNNPKALFNGLSDLCSTGLVICILENWKKFNNTNLDAQQLRNSLTQTGQLPYDKLGLDKDGLLYPLFTSMIRDGLLPKSQRTNTISQYIQLLDKAKSEHVGIPHDSPFSKAQEEDKSKILFLQNPSGVISSYIESMSRCQLKKSEEASTVIFSKPEQDKESKDEDFCLLQDSKEKHMESNKVFGGNQQLQVKWVQEENKQESQVLEQSKVKSNDLHDDNGQKESKNHQNDSSDCQKQNDTESATKQIEKQEKVIVKDVEQKLPKKIINSESKCRDDYEESSYDGVASQREIEQMNKIENTPKRETQQQLDGDVSVVHHRIAQLDKKGTIEVDLQQEQEEEEAQQLNEQEQQQPQNIDLMKQSNTQFLNLQQSNLEQLRQQQQQQQPKEIQEQPQLLSQSNQQYQQSDIHPSWLSRLGDSYWNGSELLVEYKKYLKTLSIKCKHLEEIHMFQGIEPTGSCLYQTSCLDPITYIKLTVQSQFNSLIGKGVLMAILVPFIKIFNRSWMIKNDHKSIGILFAHPLLWLLKAFNVIFMMILILFYFVFLLLFLTSIYLTYFILRLFLLFLIPVGLIRLHDRNAAKLSDFKQTALYGRQISFTWYVLDAEYRTAYDFLRFHTQVRRYQRAQKASPFQQQKALTLNNSTVSHNIL